MDQVGTRQRRSRSVRFALAALSAVAFNAYADGPSLHEASTLLRTPTEQAFLRAGSAPAPLRLFGDYFFFDAARTPLEPASGLRASTGLISPLRSFSLFDAQTDTASNQAYLGLGYSKYLLNSQLSLNADFGLASQNLNAAGRLRNAFTGAQNLDDAIREMRWAPVMSLNVRYSF